jgi:ADP-ribose pyrophosphatase YjhB (NUDIX family)
MKDDFAVQVALAVISDAQERHLWVWNDKWGSFALPMSKLRRGPHGREAPERAALRAGAEALGVPVRVTPGTLRLPFAKEGFSERLRAVRPYAYQVFGVEPHPDFADRAVPRTPHLWLTAAQALEGGYEPLSDASRDVLDRVLLVLPPGHGPLRRSRAALAVVCRPGPDGRPRWLARWNRPWNGYHFVGGHKDREESFRQCLLREAADELHLAEGTDFTADDRPLERVEYVAWSERYQAETKYEMELYRVRLVGPEAVARVDADPLNRWLSAEEIHAGRSADGQRVSEAMGQLLEQTGWPSG